MERKEAWVGVEVRRVVGVGVGQSGTAGVKPPQHATLLAARHLLTLHAGMEELIC